MYSPEISNDFVFFITYDSTDIVILTLSILCIIGFVIYRKKHK